MAELNERTVQDKVTCIRRHVASAPEIGIQLLQATNQYVMESPSHKLSDIRLIDKLLLLSCRVANQVAHKQYNNK